MVSFLRHPRLISYITSPILLEAAGIYWAITLECVILLTSCHSCHDLSMQHSFSDDLFCASIKSTLLISGVQECKILMILLLRICCICKKCFQRHARQTFIFSQICNNRSVMVLIETALVTYIPLNNCQKTHQSSSNFHLM